MSVHSCKQYILGYDHTITDTHFTCKNVLYYVSYFLCCCFSCRHVSKETFSREVLQNENSNEVSRQSLRNCVRILRSAHFRSLAGQVHVRHDPISRIFLRQFISRSLQVSRPKLRKFVRSFALHDVERKFVRIFVLQNLSSDSFCFIREDSMSWCGLESFAVEEIYSYVYWRNNCVHWLK